MNTNIKSVINELVSNKIIDLNEVIGCNDDEISVLEENRQIKLPEDYIDFLKFMGKQSGSFLKGSDFTYDKIDNIQKWATELMESDSFDYHLSKNDFVFMSHQGYQFLFFKCNDEDNGIYYYMEGEGIEKVYSNFSEWLKETVADEIDAMNEVKNAED